HGYKTYPHVDMAERGAEAMLRLADVIAGRIRPTAAFRTPPLLPPIGAQGTARGPVRRLYDLADEMERDPRVVSVSIFPGFPYADIPDAGLSTYVVTDGERELASELAERLARTAWEHRRELVHSGLPVPEAVAQAIAAEGGPIVLADMADNTGGGAAGDGTEILRQLIRVRARCGGRRAVPRGPRGGRPVREGGGGGPDHPRGRRQGRRSPRRAPLRHRRRAHPLGRALRPQGADDARAARAPRRHRRPRRGRRQDHP